MGITTRSEYSTEPNNPNLSANNGDLCAFINHPERWHETFYKGLVDSDEEEEEVEDQDGMIGDENLIVSDSDGESESIGNAMEIGDEMKDDNGAVEGQLDERNKDLMGDDDEADKAFPVEMSDQESLAATVKDIEKEEGCLGSNSAGYGSDLSEIEDEGTDSPQSDSADDNAQVENLDSPTGKEKGRVTSTCNHCGETGHILTGCKNLHLPPKYTCTRCGEKGHSKTKCRAENPGTSVGQRSFLCTHCGEKGHGRFPCQELHLPPKYTCSRCGEKGHSLATCRKKKPGYVGKVIARKKPTCSHCGEYGHDRTGCGKLLLPPKFVCPRCGEKGHAYRHCPEVGEPRKYPYGCSKCGGEDGHSSITCQIEEKKGRRQRCTYCNELGHMSKTCLSRPCIYCQGKDHRSHSCPHHNKPERGIKTRRGSYRTRKAFQNENGKNN